MTSLSKDFFEQVSDYEARVKELKKEYPFLAKSFKLFSDYYSKKIKEQQQRTTSPPSVKNYLLAQKQINFFYAFYSATSSNSGALFSDTMIEGLDDQIRIDLEGQDQRLVDRFIHKLCVLFERSNEEFVNELLLKLIIQSKRESVFSLEPFLDDVKDYNKYLYHVTKLLCDNHPTEDIFYFIDETSYSKCPGAYIELFKRYVYLVNSNYSLEVIGNTEDGSEEVDELFSELMCSVTPTETISVDEFKKLLLDENLEMNVKKLTKPNKKEVSDEIKIVMENK